MKTGEMNTDLAEFIQYYLKQLRHKKMTKDIKYELDTLGNSITISKAPDAGAW